MSSGVATNATAKALTSATPIAAERQKRLRRSLSHIGRSAFDRGRACASIESTIVTTTIAAVSGVRDQESGLASGLINTSQQIGGALGLAVLATIATTRTDNVMASAGGDPSALTNALTEGFQAAFLGGAVIAAIGFVLTLVLIRNRDSRAHVELDRARANPQLVNESAA